MQKIWKKLAMEVNRVFDYVDTKLAKNPNWLERQDCDLTDLQKEILNAFDIDIRRNIIDKG